MINRSEMGYYGRPFRNHKVIQTKEQVEGQLLCKGHGKLSIERICFVTIKTESLYEVKKRLQVGLGYHR